MNAAELVAWRENHRLTQVQLAEVLDVTKMTVWKWENGHHKIPRMVWLALWAIHRGAALELPDKEGQSDKEGPPSEKAHLKIVD